MKEFSSGPNGKKEGDERIQQRTNGKKEGDERIQQWTNGKKEGDERIQLWTNYNGATGNYTADGPDC